jgi:hypothetical protein
VLLPLPEPVLVPLLAPVLDPLLEPVLVVLLPPLLGATVGPLLEPVLELEPELEPELALLPLPVLGLLVDPAVVDVPLEEEPFPVVVDEDEDADDVAAAPVKTDLEPEGQVKLNRGVVLNLPPTIPKLGSGVVGSASWRVYHQVLVLPNRAHPTSSQ